MKPLKFEAVYTMAYQARANATADLPRFMDHIYNLAACIRHRCRRPGQFEERHARPMI